ncbi:MAG: TetR/AcrR family transcriptional regulator [Bacteroidales bacterium]|nr:TetR/AcrR family transcriptional regulator [Bacteroidales bacterium]
MSKREQILYSTLELITELGFHATPMSLIIKKSNAAAGTIYHYFKSKEDLIDTLYSDLKEEMGKAIIQNLDLELNYKEKFFLICNNLFSFFTENPKKFEFLEDYANSPLIHKEIKEINRRHYQQALDFIESGIQIGMLRELPLILMINLIFGNISCFSRMIILEEIEPTEELLNKVIQSSWDSVKIN